MSSCLKSSPHLTIHVSSFQPRRWPNGLLFFILCCYYLHRNKHCIVFLQNNRSHNWKRSKFQLTFFSKSSLRIDALGSSGSLLNVLLGTWSDSERRLRISTAATKTGSRELHESWLICEIVSLPPFRFSCNCKY